MIPTLSTAADAETYYAGVGSRGTPLNTLERMRCYATRLAERGLIVRSGGAPGADTAFEEGTVGFSPDRRRIYLPWPGYNNRWNGIVVGNDVALREIAARYHPNWARCKAGARKLHTRNVAQILGHTQPHVLSQFVLCWTERARGGGGTGQAIRIAKAYGVPVYDLADSHCPFESEWLC